MENLDCVIIGTGIAGISAALTLKLLNKKFVILGSSHLSQKTACAHKIKNYPALAGVSGSELAAALSNQLKEEDIAICEEQANGVYPSEGGYTVTCANSEYNTKCVIIATGVEAVKPVEGEREFLGRGVSYCTTCDGFLYKGKTVAVAIEDEAHLEEVELLKQYASEVHLLSLNKKIEGSEGRLTAVKGGFKVNAAVCEDREIAVDGVFILKGAVAADTLVYGLKTSEGAVVVDRNMSTNLPGVFAAGDCTGKPHQYAKAAGEGNVAAHSVNAYLNAQKGK